MSSSRLPVAPAEANFFGPANAPLFGWLHGRTVGAGVGVLICAPLGHEMTNAYRSLRALAQAAADAGLPCLRFDYPGFGDSAEPAPGRNLIAAAVASVGLAIDHLRQQCGVQRVVLLGLRSGVLVALAAAQRRTDVGGLLALAPVLSGRKLWREWRTLSSLATQRSERSDAALEVAGYVFDAACGAALSELDAQESALPAGIPVLVIDRDDLPPSQAWLAQLQSQGHAVVHHAEPGFSAMLDEPQRHEVPTAVVARVGAWLQTHRAPPATVSRGPLAATPAAAWFAQGVNERPLWLSDGHAQLFGVLTEPPAAPAQAPVLLLLNTGAVHHVGGHRLYVQLARRLAARGVRVLRLDFSGLGDSPARPGHAEGVIYGDQAKDDIALAVGHLNQLFPAAPLLALGLCAGAYHALKFTVASGGLTRVVLVNPLVYFWDPSLTRETREAEVQAAYYRRKWRDPARWLRLLSGQSNLRLLTQVVLKQAAQRLHAAWQGGTPAKTQDLGAQLRQAAAQHTALHFVFSRGEPGLPLLHEQAGPALQALQREQRLQIDDLPDADHTLSTEDARQRFMAQVERIVVPSPAQPCGTRSHCVASLDTV